MRWNNCVNVSYDREIEPIERQLLLEPIYPGIKMAVIREASIARTDLFQN